MNREKKALITKIVTTVVMTFLVSGMMFWSKYNFQYNDHMVAGLQQKTFWGIPGIAIYFLVFDVFSSIALIMVMSIYLGAFYSSIVAVVSSTFIFLAWGDIYYIKTLFFGSLLVAWVSSFIYKKIGDKHKLLTIAMSGIITLLIRLLVEVDIVIVIGTCFDKYAITSLKNSIKSDIIVFVAGTIVAMVTNILVSHIIRLFSNGNAEDGETMQKTLQEFDELLVNSNEKRIALLGGKYLRNFLGTGSLEKGFCMLSDKRVYFKGKIYNDSGKGFKFFSSVNEEKVVDLADVTGTGFSRQRYFILKIIGVLTIAVAAAGFYFAFRGDAEYEKDSQMYFIAAVRMVNAVIPAIIDIIAYYFFQAKWFEVSFAGGKMAFKASNYSKREIRNFQKMLRRAKDKCVENMNRAYVKENEVSEENNISVTDELKKFKELLDSGVLTQQEYEEQKVRLLFGK